MRLYIIGPVTGQEDGDEKAFLEAFRALKDAGHIAEISHDLALINAGTPWPDAMRNSLNELTNHAYYVEGVGGRWKARYNGVAMLDGWEQSKGACLEKQVAEAIGIPCKPWREWL